MNINIFIQWHILRLGRLWILKVFFFFAHGPCNNIHQFEGCFLIGQVSLNGFKNFNGCIVEYLNFISLSTKTLENILFWEKVVIGQYSTNCPVWLSALQCTSLVLMVFLPTVMLLKWFSVYRLLAAATQINANNQELNYRNLTKKFIINWPLSFGLNVLVFNENKYFCLKIFCAWFFLLNCLIFNIKTINSG